MNLKLESLANDQKEQHQHFIKWNLSGLCLARRLSCSNTTAKTFEGQLVDYKLEIKEGKVYYVLNYTQDDKKKS